MRCDICGSNDSVFFIKPDGSGGELRLCRACAVSRGYASAGEGLGARLDSLLIDEAASSGPCPSCGWTADNLRSSGRLGCTDCVKAFRREILYALDRSGGRRPYDGKAPRGLREADRVGDSVADLSSALERAVRSEDFEAAAAIRDRLRAAAERRPR